MLMRIVVIIGISCLATPLWAQQPSDAIVLTVNQDGTVTSALRTLTDPATVNAVSTYGNSRANIINAKANRRDATANVLNATVGEGLRTVGSIGEGAAAAPFNAVGSIGQGAPAAMATAVGNIGYGTFQGSLASSLNLVNSLVVQGSEGIGVLYNDLKSALNTLSSSISVCQSCQ
jgi:hypothetical protein